MVMKRENKRKTVYGAIAAGTVFIVLLGIFAPGQALTLQSRNLIHQVSAVPEQYYSASGSAAARNASANLGLYEKMQLITGKWESTKKEAAAYEMEMEDFEAAAAAREKVKVLYDAGLYPCDIEQDYGNWYTWDAQAYKAVDDTFGTYTAYFWKINFVKYDGTQSHIIYLLEDGTVFLAEALAADGGSLSETASLSELSDLQYLKNILGLKTKIEKEQVESVDMEGYTIAERIPYFDGDTAGMQWSSAVTVTVGEESFLVTEAYSAEKFLFAITL